MKNKFFIKFTIIDSTIASFIVILGFTYFKNSSLAAEILGALGVQNNIFYLGFDFVLLIAFALFVSSLSALVAILMQRKI